MSPAPARPSPSRVATLAVAHPRQDGRTEFRGYRSAVELAQGRRLWMRLPVVSRRDGSATLLPLQAREVVGVEFPRAGGVLAARATVAGFEQLPAARSVTPCAVVELASDPKPYQRRRSERIPCSLQAVVALGGVQLDAEVHDLSADGLALTFGERALVLPVGAKLDLWLKGCVPTGEALAFKAVVVRRTAEGRHAFRIEGPPATRERVARWVRERALQARRERLMLAPAG